MDIVKEKKDMVQSLGIALAQEMASFLDKRTVTTQEALIVVGIATANFVKAICAAADKSPSSALTLVVEVMTAMHKKESN